MAVPKAKWNYMCGVAWNKVRDLQEAARRTIGEDA